MKFIFQGSSYFKESLFRRALRVGSLVYHLSDRIQEFLEGIPQVDIILEDKLQKDVGSIGLFEFREGYHRLRIYFLHMGDFHRDPLSGLSDLLSGGIRILKEAGPGSARPFFYLIIGFEGIFRCVAEIIEILPVIAVLISSVVQKDFFDGKFGGVPDFPTSFRFHAFSRIVQLVAKLLFDIRLRGRYLHQKTVDDPDFRIHDGTGIDGSHRLLVDMGRFFEKRRPYAESKDVDPGRIRLDLPEIFLVYFIPIGRIPYIRIRHLFHFYEIVVLPIYP